MDWLGSVLGLGAGVASGGVGILGGVLGRGVLQLLTAWQDNKKQKHDLEVLRERNRHEGVMMDKQLEVDRARATQAIQHLEAENQGKIEVEDIKAWAMAQSRAFQKTGSPFADAANAFMRPFSFYLIVGLWGIYKVATLLTLILSGFVDANSASMMAADGGVSFIEGAAVIAAAISNAWTLNDWGLLGTAWGFVYADRKFGHALEMRNARST